MNGAVEGASFDAKRQRKPQAAHWDTLGGADGPRSGGCHGPERDAPSPVPAADHPSPGGGTAGGSTSGAISRAQAVARHVGGDAPAISRSSGLKQASQIGAVLIRPR